MAASRPLVLSSAAGGNTNSFPGYVIESYAAITNMGGGLDQENNGSVAMWVYLAQTEVQNPSMTLVSAGWTDQLGSWEISSFHNESSSRLALTIFTNEVAANPQYCPVMFPSIPTNTWYHLAVTWVSGGLVTAYTNGQVCATGQMNAAYYYVANGGGQRYIALMGLTHGDSWPVDPEQGDVSPNNGWTGGGSRMDDFRIYNRTLSALEVATLAGLPTMTVQSATFSNAVFYSNP
jgi:hypothetical protein